MVKHIHLFLYLLFIMPLAVFAEQVYKSVDEDGNIIFSDQPVTDKSEKIVIKPVQSVNFKQQQKLKPVNKTKNEEEDGNYQSFSISQPVNEQTIRDNQGKLIVQLNMQPTLLSSHNIVIEIDGVELAKSKSSNVELLNINRGEHTILAHIVDESGKKIISSENVVFYMHRASKLLREKNSNNRQGVTPLNPPSGQTEAQSPTPPVSPAL